MSKFQLKFKLDFINLRFNNQLTFSFDLLFFDRLNLLELFDFEFFLLLLHVIAQCCYQSELDRRDTVVVLLCICMGTSEHTTVLGGLVNLTATCKNCH